MPIRPEDRHHYSHAAGWPAIRQRIIARAKGRCEWPGCGVRNHAVGFRDKAGTFVELHGDAEIAEARADRRRVIRIVLTVAHRDQDPTHNDDANLSAWCQRHHVTWDAQQHAANAARTRAKKREIPGQTSLFGEGEARP